LNKSAIIFGSNGQDGIYLTKLLNSLEIRVVGVSRKRSEYQGSVGNYIFVSALIEKEKPDFVFHFAANSSTKHEVLSENHESISTGTLNILESVRIYSPETKVFISASAMQFKNDDNPINENTPFEASSAYSAERIYSVFLSRYYRDKFKIKIYVGYLFNHDSPLRSENHLNQKIVMSAIKIAKGELDKLIIGDVNVQKEFNYAGDIVLAIWKFISQDDISEIVIGSGKAYSIQIWIEYCFERLGLKWEDYVIKDEKFKSDFRVLVSNPELLRSIGFVHSTDIFQLADIMINSAIEKHIIK